MAEPKHTPTRHAAQKLKQRYGISEKDYNGMLTAQKGRCGICGEYRKLSVDHNHTTKKVRGLLCSNCNAALGLFVESPLILRRAIDYLTKYKGV